MEYNIWLPPEPFAGCLECWKLGAAGSQGSETGSVVPGAQCRSESGMSPGTKEENGCREDHWNSLSLGN